MNFVPDDAGSWRPADDEGQCKSPGGHEHEPDADSTTVTGIEFATCKHCKIRTLWVGPTLVAVGSEPA